MKVKCICKGCKVLNIEKNENNGIEWYSAVFMQGNEVNSNITVDKEIAPELKPMQTYDLILTVTFNICSSSIPISLRIFSNSKNQIICLHRF